MTTAPTGLFAAPGQAVAADPEPEVTYPRLYVRPSNKRPDDTIVAGIEFEDGTRKRIVLIRIEDDGETVKLRALNGNPREASSNTKTQGVSTVAVADLTPDA